MQEQTTYYESKTNGTLLWEVYQATSRQFLVRKTNFEKKELMDSDI